MLTLTVFSFGPMYAGICYALLVGMFWAAVFYTLIGPFVFCYAATPLFAWAFKRSHTKLWQKTLAATVFWGMLVGCASATAGGYFLRDYLYSVEHSTVKFADTSAAEGPTVSGFGRIVTFGSATDDKVRGQARPSTGGRHIVWGFWPVCVAPITDAFEQETVKYWAVGAGHCCAKQPMTCEFWNAPSGGALPLHFKEFYPNLAQAAADALASYSLKPSDDTQYVFFGDTAKMLSNLKYRSSVIIGGGGSFAILLMFVRAIGGSY